jgi:hypothetical protein
MVINKISKVGFLLAVSNLEKSKDFYEMGCAMDRNYEKMIWFANKQKSKD